MRFLVFFAIVLVILTLGYGFVGWRLTVGLEEGSPRRRRIWLAVVLVALAVLGAFAGFRAEGLMADVLSWIGFSALGFSSLVFTLVVIRDVVWLGARAAGRVSDLAGSNDGGEPDFERRRFLLHSLNAGKVGTSGIMLGYGLFEATTVPDVVEVTIAVSGLPAALHGLRIAQVTDLHVGPTIKGDYVRGVVERVNALEPDLVALTGDLVDGSVAYLEADVAPLGELKSRLGTFMCTGNHEYYAGVHHWVRHLSSLGITVLIDEHRVLDVNGAQLLVAGVADYRAAQTEPTHTSSPRRALAGAPEVDLKLLLAHQPRSIFEAAEVGFDVQLSGHTHGGQFFPWNFFAHLGQPYVDGLHRHDDTWIYVSRGTGYWGPPLRILAPSEITLVTLVTAD